MSITVVRHAPTASNASKTYMGSTDVPATAEGIHQAQELGLRLEGHVFDCAYSSPWHGRRRPSSRSAPNARSCWIHALWNAVSAPGKG
ncbi:hypothetical protein SA2016_0852 [Sinomonas atrocyanea]|uniref:Phosphoglycerate mutase n=1 Tax=Sinomonas atrocyanea TaxID=37927 RepID=A0A126ZWJ5_9MICC|nr:hypothetical protein SA2016_0852 [Sinomonas atrocyanea]